MSRALEAIRGHWELSWGVGGVRGALGGWQGVSVLRGQQEYRHHMGALGASRGVGASEGIRSPSGGVGGVRGALEGWQGV